MSRLLRALEADGLVEVRSGSGDGRERTAELTAAGRAEWAVLDARSDELAESIIRSYFAELAHRFENGFDPAVSISANDLELTPPAGLLLVATLHSEPIGCGALKFRENGFADVKRMWVAPSARASVSAGSC